ncbi:MAG: oligopeptide transporter, OPT family, partial [Gammaproteobacteria bacterium]|nr:oligopeptide transporter, OPT family [Gammaproteobacteria bacterium]
MADSSGPLIPAEQSLPELTFKVFVLGILLAALLAASNIYLALKLGVTIAASIPASVIAIGVLRFFRRSNVLESNIVQTCASAGEGVAAAISFVLPAMILLRLWNHFPYWETVCITLLGGILGVFYSVPLRRVLLNLPNLRFPEGTAIGNVLRASASGKGQLKLLIQGGSTAGLITFLQTGLKILSSNIQTWTVSNSLVFGMGWGLTPATLAAGYIVGFEVAVSLAVGLAVGWLIILPWLGVHYGWVSRLHNPYLIAQSLWSSKLRYVGVGVMLVGGIWTLFRLLKPLVEGLKISFRAAGKNELMDVAIRLRTDRDMPLGYLATLLSLMAVLVYSYAVYFLKINDIVSATSFIYYLAFFTLVYILAAGFFVSVICGYFTGLVGSSNNPLSGVLLISILLLGSIF